MINIAFLLIVESCLSGVTLLVAEGVVTPHGLLFFFTWVVALGAVRSVRNLTNSELINNGKKILLGEHACGMMVSLSVLCNATLSIETNCP